MGSASSLWATTSGEADKDGVAIGKFSPGEVKSRVRNRMGRGTSAQLPGFGSVLSGTEWLQPRLVCVARPQSVSDRWVQGSKRFRHLPYMDDRWTLLIRSDRRPERHSHEEIS